MSDDEINALHTLVVNAEARVNKLEGELEKIFDGIADQLDELRRHAKATGKLRKTPVARPYKIEDPTLHTAVYTALVMFQQSVEEHDDYIDNQAVQVFLAKLTELGYRINHESSLIDLDSMFTGTQPQKNDPLVRFEMACGHSGICPESTLTGGLGTETICWVCPEQDGGTEYPFRHARRVIVGITVAKDER
jgi:hypothetical protein